MNFFFNYKKEVPPNKDGTSFYIEKHKMKKANLIYLYN